MVAEKRLCVLFLARYTTRATVISTKTTARDSAVKRHGMPFTHIKAKKIPKQNVLFMQAAPSSAASETEIVFTVFFFA